MEGESTRGVEEESFNDDASSLSSNAQDPKSEHPRSTGKDGIPHAKSRKLMLRSFLSDQWFLISMGIMIPITSQYQLPLAYDQTKATAVSYTCVSLIFLITGCTLDSSILARNYARWATHLYVQILCFIACSSLMFAMISAVGTSRSLDDGILIGFLVLGCVPTTISSNVIMTSQANGNQELTLVETTIGNFIGVFISPAMVIMYTNVDRWYTSVLPSGSISAFPGIYRRVLKQLGLSIYIPLICGQAIRLLSKYIARKKQQKRNFCDLVFKDYKLSKLGSVAILVILWSTYDQAFASGAFQHLADASILFLVFGLILVWLAWFGLGLGLSTLILHLAKGSSSASRTGVRGGRAIVLDRRDVIAVTYCVAAKGPAIAVPLVNRMWPELGLELESKIQIRIAVYQTMQIAFGSLMVSLLRRYVRLESEQHKELKDDQEPLGHSS